MATLSSPVVIDEPASSPTKTLRSDPLCNDKPALLPDVKFEVPAVGAPTSERKVLNSCLNFSKLSDAPTAAAVIVTILFVYQLL